MTASTISLGQVVDVSAGQPAPKPNDFSVDGHPFIRAGSLEGLLSGRPEEACEKIDATTARRYRMRLYPKDTIVFAKSGMSAKIGRVYRLQQPSYVVSHLAALVPTGKYEPTYLAHWLRAHPPSELIRDDAYPSIRTSEVASLEVPDLALDEQKRLANILDAAESIGRKRAQAVALADDFVKSVFLDMFGDPALNEKDLPKKKLRDLGKIVTGNTPPRSDPDNFGDAIEWIKSDNVNTDENFLTCAAEGLSEKGKKLGRIAPKGSILVICIAGSPASIGRAAIADRHVAFNQQINAIIPKAGIDLYFLYAQFLVSKALVLKSSTNSMKGMINKGAFQEIEFLCPDGNTQERFGKIFKRHMQTTGTLRQDLICANKLFGVLSQRAFRGEL